MDREQQLSAINTGKRAALTLEFMLPFLDREKEALVVKLKGLYRDGTFTEMNLLACVAGLVTLDDIKRKLDHLSKKGEKESEKLHNE